MVSNLNAQSILGKWNNRDRKTGEINSVVEIYEKDSMLYAKIVHVINPELRDALCEKCKGSMKNKPVMGMNVLFKLKKKNENKWSEGYGLDPESGLYFNAIVKYISVNKIKIRAFALISLFGKTAYCDRTEPIKS